MKIDLINLRRLIMFLAFIFLIFFGISYLCTHALFEIDKRTTDYFLISVETKQSENKAEILSEWEYYLVAENKDEEYIEIDNTLFKPPFVLVCKTTDCWSKISMDKKDLQLLAVWNHENEDESKMFSVIREIVKSKYPTLYWIDLVGLEFEGKVTIDDFIQLRPLDEDSA